MDQATQKQKSSGYQVSSDETKEKFEEKMDEIKLKEKEEAVKAKAEELSLNYINLVGFPIGPETLSIISKEEALKCKTVCFLKSGKEIRLGCLKPNTPETKELIKKIREKYQSHIGLYLISEHSFKEAIKLYDRLPKIKKEVKGVEIAQEAIEKFKREKVDFNEIAKKIHEVSLTETLNLLIAGAINSKASDLHIEAEEGGIKVRYRIDGVLHTVAELPKDIWKRIISRIKLLSGMKINITNAPQDGRINLILEDGKIDVRVSTIPTSFGESVVMRLLMQGAENLTFDQLGLRGKAFEQLEKEITRPNGMVITSGPTGSGKTTALYAILNKLNSSETKTITLEDPVEYQLPGISQSQVEHEEDEQQEQVVTKGGQTTVKRGRKRYTYANGLKSILRQDPDIVMVGEIRDLETAEISIQAALTGHLLLTTIHSNDAAGVIPRFLAMGTKPFLLAPALNAIMAQRLVRKICPKCKTEDHLDDETREKVKKVLSEIPESFGKKPNLDNIKFYRGEGCEECGQSGFQGRIGIFEIFIMNAEIEKIILSGKVSEYEMKDVAVKNGMVTMVQDGLLKALDGITSVSEVFRVAE
ncbi:MAG: GspE/PulE family protein [Patescibacteria group bacterium]|nr:GspE/PulE family protein [Patescibacteria group bacterium]